MSEDTDIPQVYIVVLNWNGWKDTLKCLASLKELAYSNVQVVVVDNASTDASVERIRVSFPDITILQREENEGYAAGNNTGIQHALDHGADYVWILNNDTVVESGALAPLVEKLEQDSAVGMCGSLLMDFDNKETVQALGGGQYNKWLGTTHPITMKKSSRNGYDIERVEQLLDYIWGASVFVSNDFINSVGLMDEGYFLYYEEMDWAVRSKNKFNLGFAEESIVYHKVRGTIDKEKNENEVRTKVADYYQTKNRLKFTYTNYICYLPIVYLTVIYAFLKRLLKGKGGRAIMMLKIMFTFNSEDGIDDL